MNLFLQLAKLNIWSNLDNMMHMLHLSVMVYGVHIHVKHLLSQSKLSFFSHPKAMNRSSAKKIKQRLVSAVYRQFSHVFLVPRLSMQFVAADF